MSALLCMLLALSYDIPCHSVLEVSITQQLNASTLMMQVPHLKRLFLLSAHTVYFNDEIKLVQEIRYILDNNIQVIIVFFTGYFFLYLLYMLLYQT